MVGNDHVVQYGGRGLQLDPGVRGRVPAKSRVLVREAEDGTLRVVHVARDGRERVLRWTDAAPRAERRAIEPAPAPTARGLVAAAPIKPAADHPWRQQHGRWSEQGLARRAAHQARLAHRHAHST